MTSEQLERRAAHAARRTYHLAAERHGRAAVFEFAKGNSIEARSEAAWANRCQRWSAAEYEAIRR
jgi:hypothetical protein